MLSNVANNANLLHYKRNRSSSFFLLKVLPFRTLLSVVREKDMNSLSPYTEGRPEMFGSYMFEYMGLVNEEL